jgi:hypothetical protein
MHLFDTGMRGLVSVLGFLAVAVLPVVNVASASVTPSRAVERRAAPTFVLQGTIAGGIKTVQTDQTLTFVFTETNEGTMPAAEDLIITSVSHVNVVGNLPCVLPGGFAINSDGTSCEPGFVQHGQSVSMVITTHVAGEAGTVASVRVCLSNENVGVIGPCKTVSARIA